MSSLVFTVKNTSKNSAILKYENETFEIPLMLLSKNIQNSEVIKIPLKNSDEINPEQELSKYLLNKMIS